MAPWWLRSSADDVPGAVEADQGASQGAESLVEGDRTPTTAEIRLDEIVSEAMGPGYAGAVPDKEGLDGAEPALDGEQEVAQVSVQDAARDPAETTAPGPETRETPPAGPDSSHGPHVAREANQATWTPYSGRREALLDGSSEQASTETTSIDDASVSAAPPAEKAARPWAPRRSKVAAPPSSRASEGPATTREAPAATAEAPAATAEAPAATAEAPAAEVVSPAAAADSSADQSSTNLGAGLARPKAKSTIPSFWHTPAEPKDTAANAETQARSAGTSSSLAAPTSSGLAAPAKPRAQEKTTAPSPSMDELVRSTEAAGADQQSRQQADRGSTKPAGDTSSGREGAAAGKAGTETPLRAASSPAHPANEAQQAAKASAADDAAPADKASAKPATEEAEQSPGGAAADKAKADATAGGDSDSRSQSRRRRRRRRRRNDDDSESTSSAAPLSEAPAGETPSSETPAGEAPAGEAPVSEAPASRAPAGEAPVSEVANVAPLGHVSESDHPLSRDVYVSSVLDRGQQDEPNIAMFCDLENLVLGARAPEGEEGQAIKFDINLVLERLLEKGKVIVKRAYADWERYRDYKRTFHGSAIELIDIPQKHYSGKNSADIKLVVDALELCYSKPHMDTFVILSGDSDFSPLVSKLRENCKHVIGVGFQTSTSSLLVDNCDEFLYYEDLWRDTQKVPRLDHLSPEEAKVFGLMVDAMVALLRENKEVLWGSMIKQTMKRKNPSFSEGSYGYSSFSELLEDAERKRIIRLRRDRRSGTYVVTGFAAPRRGA